MSRDPIELDYQGHRVALAIVADEVLTLALDGVVRKRRARNVGTDCVYVWTNVELHWEEHHFLEGRWWPASGRLRLTANGSPLIDTCAR